jgi:hypothetical protein
MVLRRRRVWISLLLVSAAGSALYFWNKYPPLSAVEHQLVGNWAFPELDPRIGYVTRTGPITNPWLIREFRRDRVYRLWVVSADDPGHYLLELEGRWHVVDGKLRTEDFEGSARLARDISDRVRSWASMHSPQRISGNTDVSIDLSDEATLVITNPWREKSAWKRRPE